MTEPRKILQHLTLTALGTHQPGLINELCKLITNTGCNLLESKANTLGSELLAQFFLTGSWNAIAKLETSLAGFEQKHDIRFLSKRTQPPPHLVDQLPYSVYVVTHLQNDAVYQITNFFAEQNINLHNLSVNIYSAPFTETLMLNITLAITIPKTQLLADLRESFIIFCDDHNFDAIIEPQKN